MITWWEPTDDTYYTDAVQAETAVGTFYDVLRIEQTLDGWHGILMVWVHCDDGMDSNESGLGMADEAVFSAKYDAVMWCESKDLHAAEAQRARAVLSEDEDSVEFWDAMLDDVDTEEHDG